MPAHAVKGRCAEILTRSMRQGASLRLPVSPLTAPAFLPTGTYRKPSSH
jgi:hypothetical protein